MVNKNFVVSGNAVFTVELPQSFAAEHNLPTHYTYRVNHRPANGQYEDMYFVSVLTGPDKTNDFTYMGVLDTQRGTVRLTRGSNYGDKHWAYLLVNRIVKVIWAEGMAGVKRMQECGFWLHDEQFRDKVGSQQNSNEDALDAAMGIGTVKKVPVPVKDAGLPVAGAGPKQPLKTDYNAEKSIAIRAVVVRMQKEFSRCKKGTWKVVYVKASGKKEKHYRCEYGYKDYPQYKRVVEYYPHNDKVVDLGRQ